ncbi:MAG: response regulator [Deltaproteobacteria bacterium]|nr:response regulator [Deltaproteobacteria bacterium]
MTNDKHILIADPEAGFRFSATVALRKAGYRISEALSGLDALAQIIRLHEDDMTPDLLITNCGMPDLSGADLVLALRRLDVSVPVFAIAENLDATLLGDLAVAECVGLIEKPFPPDELVRSVDRVLGMDAA